MPEVTTDNQTLKKVEVFDVLLPFDLAQTPVYNEIVKGDNPDQDRITYPSDLPDPPTNTGTPDGQEWTNPQTLGARQLLVARLHHLEFNFGVGVVAAGNKVYGTDGKMEFQNQGMKALRRLMTSSELIMIGNQEAQAGSSSVPLLTRGAETWIQPANGASPPTAQTDTDSACPVAFCPAAAQVVSMTCSGGQGTYTLSESILRGPFFSVFNTLKSKIDYDVYCTTAFKGQVSDFGNLQVTPNGSTAVRRFDQDPMKIMAAIESWTGDCGTARFHLHPFLRFLTSQRMEALGMDYRFARVRVRAAPQNNKEIAQLGTNKRGQVLMTQALQMVPTYLSQWFGTA